MELGLPRKAALQELLRPADIDVVRTLVLALLQADALGIPIGPGAQVPGQRGAGPPAGVGLWKAAKLPIKIMFPLVLFIFPPIMAIVIGPAVGSFKSL